MSSAADREATRPSSGDTPEHGRLARISRVVRTCVGCRCTDNPLVLLRVVAVAQVRSDGPANGATTGAQSYLLRPDPRHREPGRGVWLHPTSVCFEQAVRKRAFGRALRLAGTVDISELADYLDGLMQRSTSTTHQPPQAEH